MDAVWAGVLPGPKITSGMPAQGAMVVHIGESQIFERQVAQAVDRSVRRKLAVPHLVEQYADESAFRGGRLSGRHSTPRI